MLKICNWYLAHKYAQFPASFDCLVAAKQVEIALVCNTEKCKKPGD